MNCTQLQELAAARALGALDRAGAARLEAIAATDDDVKSELAAFNDAAAALALTLTPVAPPPGLRAKVLQRVQSLPPVSPDRTPAASVLPVGFRYVPSSAEWQATPVPGFRIKLLSVSKDMGYRVVLGELSPGARLPAHDHLGSEEVFVLSGHLQTEGRLLGPGDFFHSEPGTHHHELVSPDGCLALLIDRAPAGV